MFRGLFGMAQGEESDQLLTMEVLNRGAGCDPLLGLIRVNWTTFGDVGGAEIEVYADFGSGYSLVQGSITPTDETIDLDVSGMVGFASLDTTDFRVDLKNGGSDLAGSPKFATPPYSCV